MHYCSRHCLFFILIQSFDYSSAFGLYRELWLRPGLHLSSHYLPHHRAQGASRQEKCRIGKEAEKFCRIFCRDFEHFGVEADEIDVEAFNREKIASHCLHSSPNLRPLRHRLPGPVEQTKLKF